MDSVLYTLYSVCSLAVCKDFVVFKSSKEHPTKRLASLDKGRVLHCIMIYFIISGVFSARDRVCLNRKQRTSTATMYNIEIYRGETGGGRSICSFTHRAIALSKISRAVYEVPYIRVIQILVRYKVYGFGNHRSQYIDISLPMLSSFSIVYVLWSSSNNVHVLLSFFSYRVERTRST